MFLLSAGDILVFSISFMRMSLGGFFIVNSQPPETVMAIHAAKRSNKQQAGR
jgi:hypothetical protein